MGRGEGLSSNVFGITFADALLEIASPGMPPSQVEVALKAIANDAYYLRAKDGRYYADTDPTEARIISTIKQGLHPDHVSEQLTIVARKVVSHNSPTFQVAQDVSAPEHISDRTGRPVLAIIRLDANKIDPTEMTTSAGNGQPRLEQNNVFMLVPETVQVTGDTWSEDRVKKSMYRKERLNDLSRTVIAMRRLQNKPEDYGMSAVKLQDSGFTAKLKEREMALQTTVAQAYDTILFSGASGQVTQKSIKQAGGEGGASVDEEIRRVLTEEGELITTEAASTQTMLLQLGKLIFDSIRGCKP